MKISRLKWKGTRQTRIWQKGRKEKSSKAIRSLQTAIRCGACKLYRVWKVKIEKTEKKNLNVEEKMRNPESYTGSSSLIPEVWLWKKYRKSSGVWETKLRPGKAAKRWRRTSQHPVKEASDFWKLFMGTGRKWRPFGTLAGSSERGNQGECFRTPRRWIYIWVHVR